MWQFLIEGIIAIGKRHCGRVITHVEHQGEDHDRG
jgi:hypothetical protein